MPSLVVSEQLFSNDGDDHQQQNNNKHRHHPIVVANVGFIYMYNRYLHTFGL